MAGPSPNNVLRLGGRLYINPSDLTSIPAGLGTELGNYTGGRFSVGMEAAPIPGEEFGADIDHLFVTTNAKLEVGLRTWDTDITGTLFPTLSTFVPGDFLSERVVTLLLANRVASGPSIYIPAAIPWPDPTKPIAARLTAETIFWATFLVIPPSGNGIPWYIDTLANLAGI